MSDKGKSKGGYMAGVLKRGEKNGRIQGLETARDEIEKLIKTKQAQKQDRIEGEYWLTESEIHTKLDELIEKEVQS